MNDNNVLSAQQTTVAKSETSLERFMRDNQMKEVSLELSKDGVERFLQGKVKMGVRS